jgi:hypothetical protein
MSTDRWFLVNPIIFQGRGVAPKSDHAFVIMPLSTYWSRTVWSTIKNTMTALGFSCVRADEQYGQQILEDVWKGLCEASIVVADVTGRNPNVYYELGIAHILGRRVVLLTQNKADIPFDTHIYRHISYKVPFLPWSRSYAMQSLSNELKKTVEWIRENELDNTGGPIADIYAALRSNMVYNARIVSDLEHIQRLIETSGKLM